jgi:hypothetical protein
LAGVAAFGVANTGLFFEAHFWPYVAALVILQVAAASTFLRPLVVWLSRE